MSPPSLTLSRITMIHLYFPPRLFPPPTPSQGRHPSKLRSVLVFETLASVLVQQLEDRHRNQIAADIAQIRTWIQEGAQNN